MLFTCLNNDSTIVWTRHPFIRGLLGTNQFACAQWRPCIRTVVAVNSKSLVLIEFMSNSEHAALNYVNMLVIRKSISNSICYYQTCVLTFTLYVLTLF
ncbi:hypothetical protein Hanom_Chr05g00418971 [Helianthus anomalus]